MCLRRIVRRQKPTKSAKIGYKVFFGSDEKLTFEHRRYKGSIAVPRGSWLRAEGRERIPCGGSGELYKPGFHFYLSADDAFAHSLRSQMIVRVKVRGVHTYGAQCGVGVDKKVGVAREMFVP